MTNPYPDRVLRLLASLPETARVLEVGSGARFVDWRVVSLEMVVTRGVDVAAVAEALPFPDETFDFVFSQAVLEHVPDPHGAVREMDRVLKRNGVFYAEVAFMQPLHQEPFHYFNHTEYGLRNVCAMLDVLEVEPIGSFAEVVRWLAVDAGAVELLGSDWVDRVTGDLGGVHEKQTREQRLRVASGISLLAVKR